MAGSEDAEARSCHSPTLAWRPFPTQSQPSTCTSLVWAPTDTPHGQQFCDGAAKDHESGHGFPPRRRCDLQYMGYDHQRDADQHHDGRDHESPSELRLPVHHMNQVTTRATVHRNVTSVVVQPRKFVKRPLVLAPTTFRLLVSSIMIRSNGGTEKPWTIPDQTSAFIGLNPRKFNPTARAVTTAMMP